MHHLIAASVGGCGGGEGGAAQPVGGGPNPSACGPWPDQATSPYVLPYEVDTARLVGQGNCTEPGASHQAGGTNQYAYDLMMPIGSAIVAARAGTVSGVRQHFADGTRVAGEENYVFVRHDDGSRALYFHISQNGSLVAVGQPVRRVARSPSAATQVPAPRRICTSSWWGRRGTTPSAGCPSPS